MTMSIKRKYDIGGNTTIEDDGHTLYAVVRDEAGNWSRGIGVRRPPLSLPEEVDVMYSLDGRYYYLPQFAGIDGCWFGVKEWASREEMQAQQEPGILGKEGIEITRGVSTQNPKTIYREVLHFAFWKVKSEQKLRKLSIQDDMVGDYLSYAQGRDREQEKQFNEVIAHTGKTLKSIMEKIGPWVPVEELPVVSLA